MRCAWWLNDAASADRISICFWQKLTQTGNGVTFHLVSPSAEYTRAAFAHGPWNNGRVYWDTGGQAPDAHRVSELSPAGFNHLAWHHYAFVKEGDEKSIWIDGLRLASGINNLLKYAFNLNPTQPDRRTRAPGCGGRNHGAAG